MKLIDLFLNYKWYYFTGIKVTLSMSLIALIAGTALGALLSLLRLSKSRFLQILASLFIEPVRGTPMMVQISAVYFGSYVLTGVVMNAFVASTIAVSLNSAAYVAEIIRSGIQSIDKGQTEASRSLGLSKSQTMRYIILPQAIKNILPALGNEFVTLIKETSVASVIGVMDLMKASQTVQSNSFQPFNPIVIVGIIYFILTFSLSRLVNAFERSLEHND